MPSYFIDVKHQAEIIDWCEEAFINETNSRMFRRWTWFPLYIKNRLSCFRVDIFHEDDEIIFMLKWSDLVIDIRDLN